MSELFEVISKEEFERSGAMTSTEPELLPQTGKSLVEESPAPDVKLEWCEFCKDYYIMANHFGNQEGGENS